MREPIWPTSAPASIARSSASLIHPHRGSARSTRASIRFRHLAVLDRGYALVLSAEGALIRSTAQIVSGDQLTTHLTDGTFSSRVESVSPREDAAPKSRKRGKKSAS